LNPITSKTPQRNAKKRYDAEDPNIPREVIEHRKSSRGHALKLRKKVKC
jgi:hypothetical protein